MFCLWTLTYLLINDSISFASKKVSFTERSCSEISQGELVQEKMFERAGEEFWSLPRRTVSKYLFPKSWLKIELIFHILDDATNVSTYLSHDFRVSFLLNETCVLCFFCNKRESNFKSRSLSEGIVSLMLSDTIEAVLWQSIGPIPIIHTPKHVNIGPSLKNAGIPFKTYS